MSHKSTIDLQKARREGTRKLGYCPYAYVDGIIPGRNFSGMKKKTKKANVSPKQPRRAVLKRPGRISPKAAKKSQNRAVYSLLYKITARVAVFLLALGLNATGLYVVTEKALAYFWDDESSNGNLFTAALLDFELEEGGWIPTGSNLALSAGRTATRDITVTDINSINFKYIVRSASISGDSDFCDALNLKALLEGAEDYSGTVDDFVSSTTTFGALGDEWTFEVSLPGGSAFDEDKKCDFAFIFEGWQERFDFYPQGFHDVEMATSRVEYPVPKSCEALSIGYWKNHEGCFGGEGSSVWASEVGSLSSEFSGVFSSYTGENICENLWIPNCPAGNSAESKLCKAKAHTLVDELNIVAGRLHKDALVAGADDGATAFDNLGVNSGFYIGGALGIIEGILANASSTAGEITDAAYVAERLYTFYEEENDDAPMCVMPEFSIVINEFLPNPTGADNAEKPDGEWVELYNLSSSNIDIAGWHLYDDKDSHPLVIETSNSDNDGFVLDEGETVVPSGGYLVVYLDGAYSPGWLNNGGDMARLYNGPAETSALIDWYKYDGPAPENKSYARIPDGTGEFVDPIPTPLMPNKLEDEPDEESGEELVENNIEGETSTSTEPNTEDGSDEHEAKEESIIDSIVNGIDIFINGENTTSTDEMSNGEDDEENTNSTTTAESGGNSSSTPSSGLENEKEDDEDNFNTGAGEGNQENEPLDDGTEESEGKETEPEDLKGEELASDTKGGKPEGDDGDEEGESESGDDEGENGGEVERDDEGDEEDTSLDPKNNEDADSGKFGENLNSKGQDEEESEAEQDESDNKINNKEPQSSENGEDEEAAAPEGSAAEDKEAAVEEVVEEDNNILGKEISEPAVEEGADDEQDNTDETGDDNEGGDGGEENGEAPKGEGETGGEVKSDDAPEASKGDESVAKENDDISEEGGDENDAN